ncbi:MAG: pyrroline-5-carboxylate reductase [Hyphomicrobiaceae bacterium]|nr:pyrroline-5-carboxylate reductase [Hyphomicrobiaceae bacterium]MCC0023280.1 pyrroline-5-carboxylate reductase [Hyphomicrobiaceae bacterium]
MLHSITNLTVIGAGKMGMALTRGWLESDLAVSALHLVDPAPHESIIEFCRLRGIAFGREAPPGKAGILLLAVKPQVIAEVMKGLRSRVGPETLVVSTAAGISIATLRDGLGTDRIVRTMPNTPAQVGKGVTGLVRGASVSDEDWALAHALFSVSGVVVELSQESEIDALTALSGSGPAYVFHLVEAMAAAGEQEGLDPETAMVLARQTIIGAAALLDADPADAATLRQNVTSPGGTTAAALGELMADDGLAALMKRAVHAARVRSEELGG